MTHCCADSMSFSDCVHNFVCNLFGVSVLGPWRGFFLNGWIVTRGDAKKINQQGFFKRLQKWSRFALWQSRGLLWFAPGVSPSTSGWPRTCPSRTRPTSCSAWSSAWCCTWCTPRGRFNGRSRRRRWPSKTRRRIETVDYWQVLCVDCLRIFASFRRMRCFFV